MKLKIFFFPLSLVAAVVIIIWHIWPAYEESLAHKETLQQKQKQLGILEQRKTLVDGLSVQLNRNITTKNFLFRYIPIVPDEEYLINAIDNAAKLAGINLVVVDVLQGNSQSFFGTYNDTNALKNTTMDVVADGSVNGIVPQIKQPRTEELSLDTVAIGTYDSMKKFLSEIHKIDRMHGVLSASLERVDTEDQATNDFVIDDATDSDDVILGQIVVAFAYMGNVKIPHGADGALFERGISIDKIQSMQAQHVSAPTLMLDNVGRANPFKSADSVTQEEITTEVLADTSVSSENIIE